MEHLVCFKTVCDIKMTSYFQNLTICDIRMGWGGEGGGPTEYGGHHLKMSTLFWKYTYTHTDTPLIKVFMHFHHFILSPC